MSMGTVRYIALEFSFYMVDDLNNKGRSPTILLNLESNPNCLHSTLLSIRPGV